MRIFDPILRRQGLDLMPLCVQTLDVARSADIEGIDPRYRGAYVVLERDGVVIDLIAAPVRNGRVSAGEVLRAHIRRGCPEQFGLSPAETPDDPPTITIAVCTRDRTAELVDCLESLSRIDYPAVEILVVDNAPSDDATCRLISLYYPRIRYTCEPKPGLDRARNRAVVEATGEIIVFTDDDVVVAPDWLKGIVQAFEDHPEASCVTGLVLPYELETPAQLFFELNGSFCRGFEQRKYTGPHHGTRRNAHLGPGIFGTGANMAFRRDVFDEVGLFDPALDVGTPTHGGGDIEMFGRVLEEGHTLVYEPRALVWHRHRRDLVELHRQFFGWGASYAVLRAMSRRYPRLRGAALRTATWWIWRRHLRRFLGRLILPSIVPMSVLWAEVRGCVYGITSYDRSRRWVRCTQSLTPELETARAGS
jgi:O-antigen biosynthesis protein